jgi:C_GCAxxG_C_C family probable redox protein
MLENQEEIIEKVGTIAYEDERKFGVCSQSVLGAIKEALGSIDDKVYKAGSGLGGGIGRMGDTCGALTGAVMAVSAIAGREYNDRDNDQAKDITYEMARDLHKLFIREYFSTNCRDIQTKIMGRSFNFWDKNDYESFLEAGGHDDKCPSVCKNGARWAVETLIKYKII